MSFGDARAVWAAIGVAITVFLIVLIVLDPSGPWAGKLVAREVRAAALGAIVGQVVAIGAIIVGAIGGLVALVGRFLK
jgi:hypothetical protein